jgi:DNA-binding response OmpR family regulator
MKSSPKILIIDDDPFILDMYVIKFNDSGFMVETANEGIAGLEKITSFQPDIVLLDIIMPKMDGFQVITELTEHKKQRPFKVLFLTNFGQKEDVEKGMALGADGYIIKANFTPSEVVEKVKEMIEA